METVTVRLKFSLIVFILSVTIGFMSIISCSKSPELVEIKFQLSDIKNQWLFLCQWDGYNNVVVDSVETNSRGKAKFYYRTNSPEMLAITKDREIYPVVLVVQPGECIFIDGSLNKNNIVGSKQSAEISILQKKFDEYSENLRKFQSQLPDSINSTADDSIAKIINCRIDSLTSSIRNFGLAQIKNNYFSLTSILILNAKIDEGTELFPYKPFREYYIKVDSCLNMIYPDKPMVKSFRNYIYSREKFYSIDQNAVKILEGNTIPPISFTLVDNRIVNIPGLWSKLILIDFWADWCPDCKNQPLKLKEINKEFAKKGLTIIQVAAKYNEDSLIKFSIRDSLSWMHVAEPDPYHSAIFKTLGVVKLPANFLIDRWGKVYAVDIYGDSLTSKLHSILDKPIRVKPSTDHLKLNGDSLNSASTFQKSANELIRKTVVADSTIIP